MLVEICSALAVLMLIFSSGAWADMADEEINKMSVKNSV
jgi:hypothetical protein